MKKNPRLGPEGFYVDENGKKQDADIHEEMLGGSSKEHQDRLAWTRAFAKKMGMSKEAIDSLYRYRK